MDSRKSIDVLDLASNGRPAHRRTHSSKTSIIKALLSPTKPTRKTEQDNTPSRTEPLRDSGRRQFGLTVRHENAGRPATDEKLISITSTTKVPLRPSSDDSDVFTDSPSKTLKENVDPRPVTPRKSPTKSFGLSRKHSTKKSGHDVSNDTSERTTRSPAKSASISSSETATSGRIPTLMKRGGRVMAAVAALQAKSSVPLTDEPAPVLDPAQIDADFEAMLTARNVAPHMRDKMRNLTLRVKADLVRQEQGNTSQSVSSPAKDRTSQGSAVVSGEEEEIVDGTRSAKRSRPRSRTFTFSKGDKLAADGSPSKKQRGRSKSRADTDAKTDSSTRSPSKPRAPSRGGANKTERPDVYISYLKAQPDPTQVEVGRLHKLRILLRNETVGWVDEFVATGGMALINELLTSIMKIEWREEHEDQLLHETLLCLKGLCTTESALTELERYADDLLVSLLAMLFDPEKKGPAEYSTRMVIINVLFAYLACKTDDTAEGLEARAQKILSYLNQQKQSNDEQPLAFVLDMRTPRPYQAWAKEVANVTREVFWIFLHQLNVIPIDKPKSEIDEDGAPSLFATRHFPGARPPVPAAPYIGGVEWDAAMYLTSHLDLLNGLVAALPTQIGRNDLRRQLQLSGFEKTMATTLRTCKEKFYGGIHDGLRAWVRSATDDCWPTDYVREGPTLEEQAKSARSSPRKAAKKETAPKLDDLKVESPMLDFSFRNMTKDEDTNDGWLE